MNTKRNRIRDQKEWGGKASRFLKAELKRTGIGYKELAERLNKRKRSVKAPT